MRQPADVQRRRILVLTLAGAGAGACGGVLLAFAHDPPKISQAQAQYQTTPKDIRSCGSCSLFQPPHACQAVAGTISKSGWCRLYVAVD